MLKISSGEMNYIKSLCKDGIRFDNRKIDEERPISFILDLYPQADLSISITRCNTQIELMIKYIVDEETFKELIPDTNSIAVDMNGKVHTNTNSIFDINSFVKDIVSRYKLGFIMEINVVNNDGNVNGTIFEGVRRMFSKFYVPDVNNLDFEFEVCENLPMCKTFAIFEDVAIVDPNLKEEESADSMVYVYYSGSKLINFKVENSKKLDPFVLSTILSEFS